MSNAESYDPRMEGLPLLISYPRSGSNWLNSIMELYFDRPRLRLGPTSFLKNRHARSDFMWFHDHDITSSLKLKHDNILYLYRDPCDVIFSLLMAEHNKLDEDLVDKQMTLIRAHHEKYLSGEYPSISYEKCKRDLPSEFETVLRFFKIDGIDAKRLASCVGKAKKSAFISKAIDKRYFNQKMMSAEYEIKRRDFRKVHERHIYDGLSPRILALAEW